MTSATKQRVRRASHYARRIGNRHDLFLALSVIDGQGVFCQNFIAAGEPVIECGGIILHRDEVSPDARAMQIGPSTYLVEDPAHPSLDDFLNHSCEPNLGFIHGSLALHALRDIQPGEELFFHYSTTMNEPDWTIECQCRTSSCSGRILSYCDLSDQERERLRSLVLSYLRNP
jgi:SET domain-containing protein